MKKIIAAIIGLIVIVIIGFLIFSAVRSNSSIFSFLNKSSVTINNHKFDLSVAKSDKEKQVGLSDKKSLSENSGMIFTFDKPDYYPFWMRNMHFPIDILFIANNKIVTIYRNVQPPKSNNEELPIYRPSQPADTAIELPAGTADKYNIQEGDTVKIAK